MNKIKTRRSPGTKLLGVAGIKEIKMKKKNLEKSKKKKIFFGLN